MVYSTSHSRSGQIFTTDLVISTLIFFVIVNLSLITWNITQANTVMFNDERDLQNRVTRVADLVVRSPGYPTDWNTSSIQVIGFTARDHEIDNRKLAAFHQLPYTQQVHLMRTDHTNFSLTFSSDGHTVNISHPTAAIGPEPIAVITQTDAMLTNTRIAQRMNASQLDWNLYWPSTNNQSLLPSLTADHIYTYTGQADTMFDDLITNASSDVYGTVISEDTDVADDDLTNENQLASFVGNGGTYLHTGTNATLLTDTFGYDPVPAGSPTGVVQVVQPLLNTSLTVKQSITFSTASIGFANTTAELVADQAGDRCLACRWEQGDGRVYYLAATDTDTGTLAAFTDADDAFSGVFAARFGRPVAEDAGTVVTDTRILLINTTQVSGFERGAVRLVFWQ